MNYLSAERQSGEAAQEWHAGWGPWKRLRGDRRSQGCLCDKLFLLIRTEGWPQHQKLSGTPPPRRAPLQGSLWWYPATGLRCYRKMKGTKERITAFNFHLNSLYPNAGTRKQRLIKKNPNHQEGFQLLTLQIMELIFNKTHNSPRPHSGSVSQALTPISRLFQ